MFKTKDGYDIIIGMLLSDIAGIYEVEVITNQFIYLHEVTITEDGDYEYEDSYRRITAREARQLMYKF